MYLYITFDEVFGRVLRIMKLDNRTFELDSTIVPLKNNKKVTLGVDIDGIEASFYYKQDSEKQRVGEPQNIAFLSGGFTGNFIGIACQDMNHFNDCYADFSYFSYKGFDEK